MAFTGVTIVFVVMMIILPPLSFFIVRENFDALTLLFVALVVLLAAPMLVSLVSRISEGYGPVGLVQISALVVAIGVVAWVLVLTFDPGDTLGTFLRNDTVEHFIGAFTWYLPALGLAAGVWRGIDLV